MKLNTKILQGLKTLNENFQVGNLISRINAVLQFNSTKYLGKDKYDKRGVTLTIPFIGLYDKDENKEFYEQQGVSPDQVVEADKAIKQGIVRQFDEYGKIDPAQIECYYFRSNKGKFKFDEVPGKFSIYAKFEIRVGNNSKICVELPYNPGNIGSGVRIVMGKNNDAIIPNYLLKEFYKNAETIAEFIEYCDYD